MTNTNEPPLNKVLDLLLDTVCAVDEEGRFVFVSAGCQALLGYSPGELLGRSMIELVYPDDRERTLQAAAAVMEGRPHVHFENRYVRKDGSLVEIMWSARWSPQDRLRLAVARDITALNGARRRERAMYRISEAAFVTESEEALYHHIHGIIAELLPSDLFLVALLERTGSGFTFPYVSGGDPQSLWPRALATNPCLARALERGAPLLLSEDGEGSGCAAALPGMGAYAQCLVAPLISPRGPVGALLMARAEGCPAYGEGDAELLHFVCTQVAAALERKKAEAHLRHIATHDPLTDLPNRSLFRDRFQMALERARRDDELLALLYLDLDNFKDINDSLGHEAGDSILRELAARLGRSVRQSDTVARIGGDEFTVLLINITGPQSVAGVVDKIEAAIDVPFVVAGQNLRLSASIGSALYPHHGTDRDSLFRHADTHMYNAKRRASPRRQSGH